jgi:hypothetical protein
MRTSSLVTLFVTIAVAFACGCNEIQHRHFENLYAAKREQVIEKGWIPAFVAPDARDIDFEGDHDAGRVYGTYVSSNTTMLRKHCSNTADSFRVPGYGPKWFQDDVEEASTAVNLKSKGYEVLRCDKDDFNVVFLSSRRFVYYWSVRK